MKRPEQQLHQAVARYLDLALPADSWWTTIPLGGGGRLRGAFLKSMGAKKGTPDILVIYRGRAQFIELKSDKGRLSVAQQDTVRQLNNAGCSPIGVCRSVEQVAIVLEVCGIPLRARIAA